MDYISCTPCHKAFPIWRRPEEILEWIDTHNARCRKEGRPASELVEQWVAVDDRPLLAEAGGRGMVGHFVQTHMCRHTVRRRVGVRPRGRGCRRVGRHVAARRRGQADTLQGYRRFARRVHARKLQPDDEPGGAETARAARRHRIVTDTAVQRAAHAQLRATNWRGSALPVIVRNDHSFSNVIEITFVLRSLSATIARSTSTRYNKKEITKQQYIFSYGL